MPADYSGQNLRGRSFRGQNLEAANFSGADIRSADFSDAILVGANFSRVKAGLQRRWAIFLVIVSLLLSGLSGLILGLAGYIGAQGLDAFQTSNQIAGWSVIMTLVTFCFLTIRYGIQAGLGVVAGAFAVAGVIAVTNVAPLIVVGTAASIGIGSVASAGAGAFAIAIAGAFTLVGAIIGSVAGVIAGILIVDGAKVFTIAFTFAGAVVLLSFYISWQAIKGNEKYTIVRNVAIAFAAIGGTSYRKANLTDANFTEATLKSTDFRKAILTRTYWWNARKLDLALPGTTYLHNRLVQQLVVTGDGKNKNFDRLDLRGLNLRDANLENASFIDTDFYKATLQKANLSRAILVRTQMERADLRGACLTGSCIQDWTISRETKLDGIICDCVYLKWVDGDKRDQMPHRGKFKENGFVLFAKYILDTIDIYHNKDINPRLALTVLKKMSRDYDEPLDIVAVGKRDDKVFIKVKISETVEPSQFKEDYLTRYEDGLKLVSSSPKSLPSVDELVENRLVEIASERNDENSNINITYVEYLKAPKDVMIQGEVTVETIETGRDTIHQSGSFGIGVNKGEVHTEKFAGTIAESNHMSNNYDLSNAKFGGGFAGTGGTQTGGTLYDYSSNPSLAEAAAEIQQLLQQLETTNPTTTSADKRAVVNQAIDEIENNPALKARVIAALNSSGTEALKGAINHPLAKNMMPFIEELVD